MREFRNSNTKGKYIGEGKGDIMPLSFNLSDLMKQGTQVCTLKRKVER